MPNLDARMLLPLLQANLTSEPVAPGRTTLPVAWSSTRGTVRPDNQDRVLVARSQSGLVVAVLADGMGGMAEGARAAAIAAAGVIAYCVSSQVMPLDVLLRGAMSFANDEVFRALRAAGGAALVLAARSSGAWFVAHAGDARAYHVNHDGQLTQLTADDTVKAQLKDLGRASGKETRLHDQLLQFVGVGRDFDPHVARVPDGGRGIILTSDGVHNLPYNIMAWVVKEAGHLQAVVDRLIVASEWGGGHDNGTAIAISFANGYSVLPSTVSAEFWFPGGHLVVTDGQAQQARLEQPVEHVSEPKTRSKKSRQRKTQKRTASSAPGGSEKQRQLPIVNFDIDKQDHAGPANRAADSEVPPSPKTVDPSERGS
jgi:PPM family protein phosphatase